MGSSVYLSIDIDYWLNRANSERIASSYLDKVALSCAAHSVPLRAVMNHHQMLPLVDASGADTLVNIDMHSDLADSTVRDLNCGTFVSYVSWRRTGHYHWIQGDVIRDGECNPNDPIWSRNGRHNVGITDWASLQRTFTQTAPDPLTLIGVRSPRCVGVGVCLSPSYCGWDLEQVFHAWRKRWNVPYRKGRRDECGPGVERYPR